MYSRFQKGIEICFLLLFSVTPLLMFHKTSELFEFNKMLFVYLMATIILACWVGKMILTKKIIIQRTPLDIALLAFVLSQILSMIFSIDVHTSLFGYYSRFNGGVLSILSYIALYYAYVSNCMFTTHEEALSFFKKMLTAVLASSFVVILWGIPGKFGYDLTCFIFTGDLNNNCWTDQFQPQARLFSTLGQPNWLGSFLAVAFFIGLYFFLKKKHVTRNRLPVTGYLFLNFSAILFTRSRSALFAVVISYLLFVIYYLLKKQRYIHKKNVVTTILCLLIPIVLFKTGIVTKDRWLPSIQTVHKTEAKVTSDVTDSFDIRRIVWRGAWKLGLTYPLFGTGVETFAYAYNFVKPVEHNLTSEWDFVYNKAHNEYLNYLATTGFIGLGCYLLFITYYLLLIYKKLKENLDNYLVFFLGLSWISILITNFFGFSTVTINLLFYLLPAGFITLYYHKPQLDLSTHPETQKISMSVAIAISLCGVWFVVSYFLADVSYAMGDSALKSQEFTTAAQYLRNALSIKYEPVYEDKLSTALANEVFFEVYEKAIHTDTNDPKKMNQQQDRINTLFTEADRLNKDSIKASPKNVVYWKTRAKNYYILYQLTERDDDFRKAIEALETAKKIAPTDPKIPYSEVLFYLSQFDVVKNKKPEEVTTVGNKLLAIINSAIALKPNYRDGYYAKGLVLKRMGKTDDARKIFQYILKNIDPNDLEAKNELQ